MRRLGFCTLLLLSTSASAEPLDIYGQIQVHASDERAKTNGAVAQRQAVGDEGTFIGIKGFKPFNHNLDLTFMNETAIHFQKNNNDGNTLTSQKQHWAGLRSSYGEVRAGKQYMPNKVLTYEVNQFKDQFGSATALLNPDTTVTDSVMYIQQVGQLEYAVGMGRDKTSSAKDYHPNKKVAGSLINYRTKNGLAFSAGIEAKPSTYVDSRLSANYQNAQNQLGIMVQHLDTKSDQVLGQDANAVLLSASHTQGKLTLKAQAGRKEDKTTSATKLGAVGVDYSINPKLKLYAEHSVVQDKDGSAQLGSGARLQGTSAQATSVGFTYKF